MRRRIDGMVLLLGMRIAKKLKVLVLPEGLEQRDPWLGDLIETISDRHCARVYDSGAPMGPQFDGVEVVVDQGGGHLSTREMADHAGSIKLWQIFSTGFEHFDLDYWRQKKIPVANTPGQFSAVALAECALMFMLMLARRWPETQTNLQRGVPYLPVGSDLESRRLLLIGFGASARELARMALALGMKISAIDKRDIPEEERQKFALDFVGKPQDLDGSIKNCDYLSLHLHLNSETRHIIDARRLALMKPSACLINVARGALVDENALCAALKERRLAGAGLDVFDAEPLDPNHPILKLPNVVVTPHIAGSTTGTSFGRAHCVVENIDRIALGLEPLYRIDKC